MSVVEYSLPVSELAEGTLEDALADESCLATFRKLFFESSPSVTQSIVRVVDGKVVHNHLFLTVHRFMASASLAVIANRRDQMTTMLVIGAGGCTIPSHILSSDLVTKARLKHPEFSVKVDAVEPNRDVILVASRYFGATFVSDEIFHGITSHEVDGERFVSTILKKEKYSLILVDAAEDEITEDSEQSLLSTKAPPESMLSTFGLMLMGLSYEGLLILNVLGSESRARSIMDNIKVTIRVLETGKGLFDDPLLLRIGTDGNFALLVRRRSSQSHNSSESLEDFVKRITYISDYE